MKNIVAILLFIIFISCDKDERSAKPIQGYWQIKDFAHTIRGFIEDPIVFKIRNNIYLGFGTIDEKYLGNGSVDKKPNTSFYKFNVNDGWIKTIDIPVFPQKYRENAVTVVIEDKLYIGLGRTYDTITQTYIGHKDFWVCDITTKSWSKLPFEFPGTPRVGAIGFTVNNKAYIGGGVFDQDYETDFYELNPATGWKQIGDITEIRYGATAFVVNNTAYLGLGWTKHEEDRIPPYLMKLNQPTGIWQKVQYNKDHDIDALQRADPAIFIIKHDDKEFVYFVGGDKFLSPPNSSWRYNVQQNIWIRERDFPELVYNQIGFTINNRAFIIIPRTYSLDTWEYVLK